MLVRKVVEKMRISDTSIKIESYPTLEDKLGVSSLRQPRTTDC